MGLLSLSHGASMDLTDETAKYWQSVVDSCTRKYNLSIGENSFLREENKRLSATVRRQREQILELQQHTARLQCKLKLMRQDLSRVLDRLDRYPIGDE